MWSATVDGRRLTFHLAGINNQNFLMRDDETGSWWQQVTGEAILGPLAGRRLEPVLADEVTFDLWRAEHPTTRVLLPDDSTPWRRFSENWEAKTGEMPTPPGAAAAAGADALPPREIVIGMASGDAATAYRLTRLVDEGVVLDTVGSTPVVLVVGEDGASVRAFDRRVDGRVLQLFRDRTRPDASLVDAETGSTWDFGGRCLEGPLAGRQLARVAALRDYWFDWKTYHPDTRVAQKAGTEATR